MYSFNADTNFVDVTITWRCRWLLVCMRARWIGLSIARWVSLWIVRPVFITCFGFFPFQTMFLLCGWTKRLCITLKYNTEWKPVTPYHKLKHKNFIKFCFLYCPFMLKWRILGIQKQTLLRFREIPLRVCLYMFLSLHSSLQIARYRAVIGSNSSERT